MQELVPLKINQGVTHERGGTNSRDECDRRDRKKTPYKPPFRRDVCCGILLMMMIWGVLLVRWFLSPRHPEPIYRPHSLLFFRPRYSTPGYGLYRVTGHHWNMLTPENGWIRTSHSYTGLATTRPDELEDDDTVGSPVVRHPAVSLTWYVKSGEFHDSRGMAYHIETASEPAPSFLGANATLDLPWRPSSDDDTYTITVNATVRQGPHYMESFEDDAFRQSYAKVLTVLFFEDYGFHETPASSQTNTSYWVLVCKDMPAEECVALAQDSLIVADDIPTYDKETTVEK